MPKTYTWLTHYPTAIQDAAVAALLEALAIRDPDAEDAINEASGPEGVKAEIVTDDGMVYSVRLKTEIVCEGRRSCSACGGSGEGWRPESACQTCGGSGYATPARAED